MAIAITRVILYLPDHRGDGGTEGMPSDEPESGDHGAMVRGTGHPETTRPPKHCEGSECSRRAELFAHGQHTIHLYGVL